MRSKLLILMDVTLIAGATISAFVLRSNFDVNWPQTIAFLPYLLATVLFSAGIIYFSGLEQTIWRFSGSSDYKRLVTISVAIVVCAVMSMFSYDRLANIARALPIIQAVLMSAVLIGARVLYRMHRARRTGRKYVDAVAPVEGESCILLVGLNPVSELYVACAKAYASKRIAICGIMSERSGTGAGRAAFGLPVLGDIEKLPEVLSMLEVHGTIVQRVVVTADIETLSQDQRASIAEIENRADITVEFFAEQLDFVERRHAGKVVSLVPPLTEADPSAQARSFDALETCSRRSFWTLKRCVDAILVSVLLAMSGIAFIAVGMIVFCAIGAPVLFWQFRPGQHGLRFRVYKFRTMLSSHDRQGRRIPDDERMSRFGRILRLTRLDELPQLFNILRGDMSFIGPRPLLLSEQAACPAARLLVRPGLTGWAQVNGGRKLSVDDKLLLDLWYIKHASMLLDLKIVVRTIGLLMHGEMVDAGAIRLAREEFGNAVASVPHFAMRPDPLPHGISIDSRRTALESFR